jgi:hypothetical protein
VREMVSEQSIVVGGLSTHGLVTLALSDALGA